MRNALLLEQHIEVKPIDTSSASTNQDNRVILTISGTEITMIYADLETLETDLKAVAETIVAIVGIGHLEESLGPAAIISLAT